MVAQLVTLFYDIKTREVPRIWPVIGLMLRKCAVLCAMNVDCAASDLSVITSVPAFI